MGEGHAYGFVVLGRYAARLKGNESHVTVNVLAGTRGHLTHCGTLTMSESEWRHLRDALRSALGEDLEVEDPASPR